MLTNWLLFENVCFAIYTIHVIVFTSNKVNYENITRITSLYNSTNYTNIIVRYLYLYILSAYLPFDNYYMYALHLPQTYNTYIEPILQCASVNLFKLVKVCIKLIFILLFYLTMRVYPDTNKIHPKYLYWSTHRLYRSDIFGSISNIFIMYILKILRVTNYPSYKMYKYLYYYKYKFEYESEFEYNDVYNYFNYNIVIVWYCQPFVDTPKFAYYIHNILPHTFMYIVYNYYIYNILECSVILFSNNHFLNTLLLITLIHITDGMVLNWHYIYAVRCIALILLPSQWFWWWIFMNEEVYTFLKLIYEKYLDNNIIITNKFEKIIIDENFFK